MQELYRLHDVTGIAYDDLEIEKRDAYQEQIVAPKRAGQSAQRLHLKKGQNRFPRARMDASYTGKIQHSLCGGMKIIPLKVLRLAIFPYKIACFW